MIKNDWYNTIFGGELFWKSPFEILVLTLVKTLIPITSWKCSLILDNICCDKYYKFSVIKLSLILHSMLQFQSSYSFSKSCHHIVFLKFDIICIIYTRIWGWEIIIWLSIWTSLLILGFILVSANVLFGLLHVCYTW